MLEYINWKEFKLLLDRLYRIHQSLGNIHALNILDSVYDRYQKGYRGLDLILDVESLQIEN